MRREAGRRSTHVVIDLREEATVKALRAEVATLEAKVKELETRCHRAEFDLMWEFRVNEQITDLCRESGVSIPRRLFSRPPGYESPTA